MEKEKTFEQRVTAWGKKTAKEKSLRLSLEKGTQAF